jgi:hypothetical protein
VKKSWLGVVCVLVTVSSLACGEPADVTLPRDVIVSTSPDLTVESSALPLIEPTIDPSTIRTEVIKLTAAMVDELNPRASSVDLAVEIKNVAIASGGVTALERRTLVATPPAVELAKIVSKYDTTAGRAVLVGARLRVAKRTSPLDPFQVEIVSVRDPWQPASTSWGCSIRIFGLCLSWRLRTYDTGRIDSATMSPWSAAHTPGFPPVDFNVLSPLKAFIDEAGTLQRQRFYGWMLRALLPRDKQSVGLKLAGGAGLFLEICSPQMEQSDGMDNDCDGVADNGFVLGQLEEATETRVLGWACDPSGGPVDIEFSFGFPIADSRAIRYRPDLRTSTVPAAGWPVKQRGCGSSSTSFSFDLGNDLVTAIRALGPGPQPVYVYGRPRGGGSQRLLENSPWALCLLDACQREEMQLANSDFEIPGVDRTMPADWSPDGICNAGEGDCVQAQIVWSSEKVFSGERSLKVLATDRSRTLQAIRAIDEPAVLPLTTYEVEWYDATSQGLDGSSVVVQFFGDESRLLSEKWLFTRDVFLETRGWTQRRATVAVPAGGRRMRVNVAMSPEVVVDNMHIYRLR